MPAAGSVTTISLILLMGTEVVISTKTPEHGFDPEQKNYHVWRFLDYLSSRSVLFTNIAYAGRFKTESFYFVKNPL